jgi:hypothetical protein
MSNHCIYNPLDRAYSDAKLGAYEKSLLFLSPIIA